MNVLLDISVLGLGHKFVRSRTGIYRVIENVAEQLAKRQECELRFCSNVDLTMVGYSLVYLRDKNGFSGIPFSKPSLFDRKVDIKTKKIDLIKIYNGNAHLSSVKKLQIKWQIRQMLLKEKMYYGYNDDLVHPKDLKWADIYHSPFYPIPNYVKTKKKISFITSHDLIPILFPQYSEAVTLELLKSIVRSISYDTWVLCVSHSTRNDLLNYLGNKVDPGKVVVTKLAASHIFYQCTDKDKNRQIRNKYSVPDSPYMLSLCTLEPRKNIDQAIKAFKKLITDENIKDLNLVLVGTKGWMFNKIFSEIGADADFRKRVIITGYVADEDLASLYSDALLFVYPSFYEGFGLPPLEAMKCGTPVITSNTSSLPEVVGDAAIMVAPTDLDALCEAMLSIYKNASLRDQMVTRSLERASQFSWERCAEETVNAYKASLS